MSEGDEAGAAWTAVVEMAPVVEAITGWRGLLDGLRVEARDDVAAALTRSQNAALGWEPDPLRDAVTDVDRASAPLAFYDPLRGVIVVDRAQRDLLSPEALRGLMGHELVHVGQFRVAGVLDTLRALQWTDRDAQGDDAPRAREALVRFMANLEGYAHYLEEDVFGRHADVAPTVKRLTEAEGAAVLAHQAATARDVVARFDDPRHAGFLRDAWMADKARQYALGAKAYRARAVGDRPARFDPHLRPAERPEQDQGGDLAALREAAEGGNPAAQSELAARQRAGHCAPADAAETLRWLRSAADAGDAVARYYLARCYQKGDGVEQDVSQALTWFARAGESGSPTGWLTYGMLLAAHDPSRISEAFDAVKRAADARDPDALAQMATWCLDGVPGLTLVRPDPHEFAAAAAAFGRPQGMHELGRCYLLGRGVTADPSRARAWIELAASRGHAPSRLVHAMMTLHGLDGAEDVAAGRRMLEALASEGQGPAAWQLYLSFVRGPDADADEARRWLARAVELGSADARVERGINRLRGEDGEALDLAGAAEDFRAASAMGHAKGMRLLSGRYSRGEGVERDLAQARALMEQSARRGDGAAQHVLAHDLLHGLNGPVDVAGSVRWYERAVAQKVDGAAFDLAAVYYHGFGVTKDRARAHRLFRVGAAQGDARALRSAGLTLLHGEGCRRDLARAVGYLTRAAEKGERDAAFRLAELYGDKNLRMYDAKASRRWRALAARAPDGAAR